MNRPQCRICAAKHYSREPHVWADEPKPVNNTVNGASSKKAVVNTTVNRACQGCADKAAEIERLKAEIARMQAPKDRKAYMRDYMRRRRG